MGYKLTNRSPGGRTSIGYDGKALKGRTYEDIYGIDGAKIQKEKRRLKSLGHKVTEETKDKSRKTLKETRLNPEYINPLKGRSNGPSMLKGKTLEEIHGVEKSEQIKNKIKEKRSKQIITKESIEKGKETKHKNKLSNPNYFNPIVNLPKIPHNKGKKTGSASALKAWETKRRKAAEDPNYVIDGKKGKTLEDRFGIEKANEIKKKMSEAKKDK